MFTHVSSQHTVPDNATTKKYLPKLGPTRLTRSATITTATSKIPQHWLENTTKVIGQVETVEARQKLAE